MRIAKSHSPRKRSFGTKCLTITEISPSANQLPQHHAGYNHIGKLEKPDFFVLGNKINRNRTADNTAVNGKSAVPNRNDIIESSPKVFPESAARLDKTSEKNDKIQPCAYNGGNDCYQRNIEDIIEGKKQRIRDQIEEALSVPPRSEYMDIARTALAGRDPEEAFAGLLSLIYRNELDISQYRHIEAIAPKSQKEKKSRRERKEEARNREPYDKVRTPSLDDQGTTKLFIARGRRDGLTKGMLCNIIMDQAGVRDQDIGDIEILEDCSFVTAPYAIAEDILNAYSGRTQKGKPVIMRAKQESRKTPKKETRKKSAAKTRKRRNWEDDYQPYGRDTRPGEDGRFTFPDKKRKRRKR